MKRTLYFCFLLSAFCFAASAANVVFSLSDFVLNPATNTTVRITPKAAYSSGNYMVTGDSMDWTSGTDGTFTVTNMSAGAYSVEIRQSPYSLPIFSILVPATNGTVQAVELQTTLLSRPGAVTSWTTTASDARYAVAAGLDDRFDALELQTNGTMHGTANLSELSSTAAARTNLVRAAYDKLHHQFPERRKDACQKLRSPTDSLRRAAITRRATGEETSSIMPSIIRRNQHGNRFHPDFWRTIYRRW